jgi:hypothetical protein
MPFSTMEIGLLFWRVTQRSDAIRKVTPLRNAL